MNSCNNGRTKVAIVDLDAPEFAEKIEQVPDAQIIDVRTPEEFAKGHLLNAQNIDWQARDFGSKISNLDKTRPVFVYCLSGSRSAEAADRMFSNGFREIYELRGGIMNWRADDLPEAPNESGSAGLTQLQFDSLTISNTLVLIDFYADWCGPCQRMKPYLVEISESMANRISVVRINADENQQLCKLLKVETLPVLMIYDKGTLTWTHAGFISREDLLNKLNDSL